MAGRSVDVVTVQVLESKTRMPWARDEILATAKDYYVKSSKLHTGSPKQA